MKLNSTAAPRFSRLDEKGGDCPQPGRHACSQPVAVWAVVLLLGVQSAMLVVATLRWPVLPAPGSAFSQLHAPAVSSSFIHDTPCSSALAGALVFDAASQRFVGCNGDAWNQLAFCCTPERPAAPELRIWRDPEHGIVPARDGLNIVWDVAVAKGSPVISYTVCQYDARPVGEQQPSGCASGGTVCCSGPEPSCRLPSERIDVSRPHWFNLLAHSAAGSSELSASTALQRAPRPLSFEALDNGNCVFDTSDKLILRFDTATNMPLSDSSGALREADVAHLLNFSTDVGPIFGVWATPSELHLTLGRNASVGAAVGTSAAYLVNLSVTLRAGGQLLIAPTYGLSPISELASPPLTVPGCILEGFEAASLYNLAGWALDSHDADTGYSISLDSDAHSGSRALRLSGGRNQQFDGFSRQLGAGSRPSRLSFWLRTATRANIGYFSLGGPQLEDIVVFFHLKPEAAGLVDDRGYFQAGPYKLNTWLHVRIDLNWEMRHAALWLDDSLIADDVSFHSVAQYASSLHLFNMDHGDVWWDGFALAEGVHK